MRSLLHLVMALAAPCLFSGCQTTSAVGTGGPDRQTAEASAPRAVAMADWQLRGTRIIGCCCTAPCPCRINLKPTHCHGCHFTEGIHVDEGHLGGVKMDGVDWVIVGRGFGQDASGTWSHVYVSDRASDAQVEALGKWFEACVAGLGSKTPFLVGQALGMRKVPLRFARSADRREIGFTIPGVLEVQTRAIVNPGRSEPVVSTGILDSYGDRFVHAEALVHKLDDPAIGRSFDLAGRQANQADFVLDAARVAKGGIGWGCWSAHDALGDKKPYPEQQIGHPASDGPKPPAAPKK
ncbi:MAG: DUF1326 domain-containing protein [Planctomycetota bacterium]